MSNDSPLRPSHLWYSHRSDSRDAGGSRPTAGFARRALARVGAVLAAAALLLGLGAGVATAHVSVNPDEAPAGSYAKLTFRVPNESAEASTVSLTVSLPTDHPFASVSLLPLPGWTADAKTTTLDPPVTTDTFTLDKVTSSVTWTADDGVGIKPGQFQEFSISVGPVPEAESLSLPAIQTYSDGEVVKWDQPSTGGHDDSVKYPAPTLKITQGGHGAGAADADATGVAGSDATAQLLGALALVLGAVALVIAVSAWKRSGRRQDSDAAKAA